MTTTPLQKLSDRLVNASLVPGSQAGLETLRQRLSQAPTRPAAPLAMVPVQPQSPPATADPAGPVLVAVALRPQSAAPLSTGRVVSLTVRFSEPVSVSGRPSLGLALQSGIGKATYLGGSGSTDLRFLYAVQPGDQAELLRLSAQAPLQLNGGRILAQASAMPVQLPITGTALSAALATLPPLSIAAGADPALQALDGWNHLLLEGIGKLALPPALASRALALLNAACFDCINAARGSSASGYAFNASPAAWQGADLSAALAQVAGLVLSEVFSSVYQITADGINLAASQSAVVAAAVSAALQARPTSHATDRGLALGRQVGELYLALRAGDRNHLGSGGYSAPAPSQASTTPPGDYVATVVGFPKPPSLPDWGQVTPWISGSLDVSLPGTTPPGATTAIPTAPSLSSDAYARDFNEVKSKGERNSTTRTADETDMALFWANGPKTVTPPGHWQEIVTTIARQKNLGLLDTSRLYAAVGLALADAAIAAWDVKYNPPLWRPVTAIQQADRDGNANTEADPSWSPFIATPAFPTYPSGHSTFSAAAAAAADALVGAVQPFSIMGGDHRTIQRQYTSLWEAAVESGRSRIMGGIHFEFDNLTGLAMGQAIGSLAVDQALMAQVWLADAGVSYRHDPHDPEASARAVQGGLGNDQITGAGDQGNRLFGNNGNDLLQGGFRADVLSGGEGQDVLFGLGGSDVLLAGGGGDRLVGSAGFQSGEVDQLVCGSGQDTVVLSRSNDQGLNYTPANSYAWVKGFDPLVDTIELSRSDFTAGVIYSFKESSATTQLADPPSSWLYRGSDAIACFEGVSLARWGQADALSFNDSTRLHQSMLLA